MSGSGSSDNTSGGGKGARVRLDEALSGWPAPERTALEWDESAEGVMARLGRSGKSGDAPLAGSVSDEDLFAPPLPAAPEEVQGSAPSMNTTSSRQRDRANLKELAKLAETATASGQRVSRPSWPGTTGTPSSPGSPSGTFEAKAPGSAPPPPVAEREENSGIINLAALTPDPAAAEEVPPPVASKAAASATAPAARAAAPKEGKPSGRLYIFGSVIAAAAVAAGVFVGMRGPASDLSAPVAAVPATVQAAPVAAPKPVAAPAPVAEGDKGVDPSSLPPVDTSGMPHVTPSAPKAMAAAAAPSLNVGATATNSAPDPKLVAVIPTSTASSSDGKSLEALMQQAAGVTSGATTAATATPDSPQVAPGSVPLRPAIGAIRGALGAALPGAQACLGPDDPISHAMVTFQSDGSVQSVTVSGGAAGKPAEACIRAALMKARVPPFASPIFSAPATIRGS
jgi:hypothetical protein